LMGVVLQAMYDPELNRLAREISENQRIAQLTVVDDPMYGKAVTNLRPLKSTYPDVSPLFMYCGPEFTLVVHKAGCSACKSETYDFDVGSIEYKGQKYDLSLRGPKRYKPNGTLAPFFNHRCPVSRDEDSRLRCFLRGSFDLAIRIPVVYAPWSGLPKVGMTLEYNYGPLFWDTLDRLVEMRADSKRVMWCICRHREGLSCPLKRGRLMPPPVKKGKKGKPKSASTPPQASRVVVLSDSD